MQVCEVGLSYQVGCYEWVHCTTQLEVRKFGGVWMSASARALHQPITWVRVFQISESGTLEVNQRKSVALIEVSVEFRLKLSFRNHGTVSEDYGSYWVMFASDLRSSRQWEQWSKSIFEHIVSVTWLESLYYWESRVNKNENTIRHNKRREEYSWTNWQDNNLS